MKTFLIASAALAIVAAPAQAQLGGAIGGVLGGSGSGSIGVGSMPSLPSPPDVRDLPVRGAAEGAARGSGSAKADRRSGRVDASGQGNGNAAGSLTGPLVGSSGSGSASASGSTSAQLIGTEAVRSTAQSARGTVQATAQGAVGTAASIAGTAQGTASYAGSIAGSAAANGQGNAGGMFSGAAGQLALAGSAAAAGNGAFSVDKGMPVLAPDGERIGKVRQVVADGRGKVQALLIKVDGEKALIPAAQFSGSGNVLVSAMGEATIKQIAEQQDETGANDI